MAAETANDMTTITIEVPAFLADTFGVTPAERSRFATEALVIEAYRRRLESNSLLGEIVGVPRADFASWLAERNVPDNGTVRDMVRGYNAGKRFLTSTE